MTSFSFHLPLLDLQLFKLTKFQSIRSETFNPRQTTQTSVPVPFSSPSSSETLHTRLIDFNTSTHCSPTNHFFTNPNSVSQIWRLPARCKGAPCIEASTSNGCSPITSTKKVYTNLRPVETPGQTAASACKTTGYLKRK